MMFQGCMSSTGRTEVLVEEVEVAGHRPPVRTAEFPTGEKFWFPSEPKLCPLPQEKFWFVSEPKFWLPPDPDLPETSSARPKARAERRRRQDDEEVPAASEGAERQLLAIMRVSVGRDVETRGYFRPRRRGDSGKWQAVGTVDGRRRRFSTNTTDYECAVAQCVQWTVDAHAGRSIGGKTPPVKTIHELAARYGESRPKEMTRIERFLRDVGKQKLVTELDQTLLDHLRKERARRTGAAVTDVTYKREILGLAKAMVRYGSRRKWCAESLFEPVPDPGKPVEYLNVVEYETILSNLPTDVAEIFQVGVGTGARPNELMRVDIRNWNYGVLTLDNTKAVGEKRRNRHVKIFPSTEELLDRIAARGTARVMRNEPDSGRIPAGRFFVSVAGKGLAPLRADGTLADSVLDHVNAELRKAAAEAGVVKPGGVTVKILRHTWATWWICVFRDIGLLTKIGDWSSVDMVRKHYANLEVPARMRPAVARVWGIDLTDLDKWRMTEVAADDQGRAAAS